MEEFTQSILNISDGFSRLFMSANLQVLLLIGSGILAISLLVLALTKWGHSRPVWKCVILSFIAHILLMGYAYATYLFMEQPIEVAVANPLQVNLVEEYGESLVTKTSDQQESERKSEAWERLADQAIPTPDREPLDRPLVDSELVVETEASPTNTAAAEIETPRRPTLPTGVPELNELATEFKPARRARSNSAGDDQAFQAETPTSVAAQPIEIARRGDASGPKPSEFPTFGADADAPSLERQSPATSALHDSRDFLARGKSEGEKEASDQDLFRPLERIRFAADQSMPDQLAVVGDKVGTARPLKTSSKSGRIKVIKSTRRLGDGQKMPKIYSLRAPVNRVEIARRRGGSVLTERAVEAALKWLSQEQQENGRWDPQDTDAGRETKTFGHDRDGAGAQADTGITALATLAFLAGGHSHFEGQYQQNVQRSLEYLASQQASDGNLAGSAKLFARMYCHSMSLLALSEALAMTGDQRLLPIVQRGVDYCVAAQNRNDGGWRYQPGDGGDMSQFGWMVMALRSAKMGGAVVPSDTFTRMRYFLDRCSGGVGDGLASYRPGQGASTSMTAEALLCRYLLDDVPAAEGLRIASKRISEEQPSAEKANLYYWYYGTLALRHVGGDAWDQWNARLKAALVSLQNTKGPRAGSWEPDGLWGGYGGRVYATSMAALNLEVYYRYLPTHEAE